MYVKKKTVTEILMDMYQIRKIKLVTLKGKDLFTYEFESQFS